MQLRTSNILHRCASNPTIKRCFWFNSAIDSCWCTSPLKFYSQLDHYFGPFKNPSLVHKQLETKTQKQNKTKKTKEKQNPDSRVREAATPNTLPQSQREWQLPSLLPKLLSSPKPHSLSAPMPSEASPSAYPSLLLQLSLLINPTARNGDSQWPRRWSLAASRLLKMVTFHCFPCIFELLVAKDCNFIGFCNLRISEIGVGLVWKCDIWSGQPVLELGWMQVLWFLFILLLGFALYDVQFWLFERSCILFVLVLRFKVFG